MSLGLCLSEEGDGLSEERVLSDGSHHHVQFSLLDDSTREELVAWVLCDREGFTSECGFIHREGLARSEHLSVSRDNGSCTENAHVSGDELANLHLLELPVSAARALGSAQCLDCLEGTRSLSVRHVRGKHGQMKNEVHHSERHPVPSSVSIFVCILDSNGQDHRGDKNEGGRPDIPLQVYYPPRGFFCHHLIVPVLGSLLFHLSIREPSVLRILPNGDRFGLDFSGRHVAPAVVPAFLRQAMCRRVRNNNRIS
mmetsp:Transcript_21556/g.42818  ORF Transcript_21556/g.42818 Transcript_21556/m.42818 type:complete len:254 (+) Transcript_21556:4087-4848(+)